MCQSNCIEIFANAPETADRAQYINDQAPDCGCEGQVVSPHCADPIDPSEVLVRIVIDDTHIVREDDGSVRLRSSFMSDAMSFGASCMRRGRATKDELLLTVDEVLTNSSLKADGTPKGILGYVLLSVNVIKSVRITQAQKVPNQPAKEVSADAFGVYATGLTEIPNHSDIFINGFSNGIRYTRSAQNRSVRDLSGKSLLVEITAVSDLIALGV
jgi:hypothetical protein